MRTPFTDRLVLVLGLVTLVLAAGSSSAAPAFAHAPAGLVATQQPPEQPEAEQIENVAQEAAADEPDAWSIDSAFADMNGALASVFFYPIPIPGTEGSVPLAVLILVLGALFFTVRMGFPQFRSFKHAIDCVRGKYDDPTDEGEVTSFQALTAALSATVGNGNIAGVAIAIGTGGPGAMFWMMIGGFLGMASKFTECTLGQMYRERRPDGRVMGGAMYYLSKGLGELGFGPIGKFFAVWFAIVCIGASFGGGNTFQVNQSLGAVRETLPFLEGNEWMYGVLMALLVGVVIIGGFQRIASTAEKIVPLMCAIYLLAAVVIILMNVTKVPAAFASIFEGAFTPQAGLGGFIGVLVTGFKRAAFSNEAGIGSAAIAHSAARVPHPSREGVVALLEPFIDTIVVCTMTALVIIITGAWDNPAYRDLVVQDRGAALTSNAMSEHMPFMKYVVALATFLFAYSTMISWSYYGERCWVYLFGDRSSLVYKIIFILFVVAGSVVTATNILNFGDLLIFGMVFPNIIGVVLLSGKVKRAYDDYMARLAAGEYKAFK